MNACEKSADVSPVDVRRDARQAAVGVVSTAAGGAAVAAIGCALLGWGWAGAIAAVGISSMGAVAAWAIVRYT